jgi:hypothetical protein
MQEQPRSANGPSSSFVSYISTSSIYSCKCRLGWAAVRISGLGGARFHSSSDWKIVAFRLHLVTLIPRGGGGRVDLVYSTSKRVSALIFITYCTIFTPVFSERTFTSLLDLEMYHHELPSSFALISFGNSPHFRLTQSASYLFPRHQL